MTRHSIHDVQHPTAENPDDGIVASAIDLTKVYGSKDNEVMALDHVNVEFKRGEMTAIMGPSGSGKSTLMHCMAGLDAPSSGKVMVEGLEVSSMNQKQLTDLRREQIGFIFQSFNLVPTLSAEENILLPLQIAKRPIDRDWFNQVVKVVGLEKRLTHRPSQLSGGQQQRVACARAIMARPSVIFADEPTGNLDSRSSREVLGFLRDSVRDYGQSIVMVTHDPRAASFADRVLVLADGNITPDMPPPTSTETHEVIAGDDDIDDVSKYAASTAVPTVTEDSQA
ncbi:ABC transporter ATP-binding protein [Bifidobacterium sp.]|uniref:ABC transporter ATP-binding protein n=1 Tax=Bifidobacterium sp. TaxID=41200 RepID=UPI00257AB06A|nr:ABC transporter ATP-binding protein [Bifidobacterium sp.]